VRRLRRQRQREIAESAEEVDDAFARRRRQQAIARLTRTPLTSWLTCVKSVGENGTVTPNCGSRRSGGRLFAGQRAALWARRAAARTRRRAGRKLEQARPVVVCQRLQHPQHQTICNVAPEITRLPFRSAAGGRAR